MRQRPENNHRKNKIGNLLLNKHELYVEMVKKSSRFSPDLIPAEMKQHTHWCVYGRRGQKGIDALNEDGKLNKIPFNPTTGKAASSNKPETWATFNEAVTAYNRGTFNGVGYFFRHDDDGMAGIDIDHKFVAGKLDDDARQIVDQFPNTYIELSPSGDGLHIYTLGMPIKCGKGTRNKWLEVYGQDVQGKNSHRYFCVTGNAFENAPSIISTNQKGLSWLFETFKKSQEKVVNQSRPTIQKNKSPSKTSHLEKYVRVAFENQIANVKKAVKGSRNVELYKAAASLKEFANSDWSAPFISESEIESSLLAAASTLPKREILTTIASAFKGVGSSTIDQPQNNQPYVTKPTQTTSLDEWENKLKRNKYNAVVKTRLNIKNILCNHPAWKGVIAHNNFTHQINKVTPPPYPHSPNNGLGEWTDSDNVLLSMWLAENYDIEIATNILQEIIVAVALSNSFNPVYDYLEDCHKKWIKAGKPRGYATRWVETHLGAIESPATRTFQKAWIISAVARVYEPGCKVDTVLILEGAQGLLKSTALAILAGEWISDTPIDFTEKDSLMIISEHWIIEMPELDKFKKADSDKAKSFFARQEDKYRVPYGHNLITMKRQCVFAGTTNTDDYLKDATGNRRYMPIKCLKKCDIKKLQADRDFIFGEAVEMYKQGEPWWYDDNLQYVQDAQNDRFAEDVWQEEVEQYLKLHKGVTIQMVLTSALKMDLDKCGKLERNRIADILRKLNWKQATRVTIEGERKRGWVSSE